MSAAVILREADHTNTFTASAAKRGRFADRPYVPVVVHVYEGPDYACPKRWTKQVRPFAFATRDEAVDYARKYIAANYERPRK